MNGKENIEEILRSNKPQVKDDPTFLLETQRRMKQVEGIKAEVDRQRSHGRILLIVTLALGIAIGAFATFIGYLCPFNPETSAMAGIIMFLTTWKQYFLILLAALSVSLAFLLSRSRNARSLTFCIAVTVITSLLTLSCNNNATDGATNVNATKWDKDPDSHFASQRIIPLETNEDILMGDIKNITTYNDTYFILDSRNVIFRFDRDGRFLSKIARQGRGHGEYSDASIIDVFGDEVYVLSTYEKKILTYSFDGEFHNEISLDEWYFDMAVEDSYILLFSNNSNNSFKNYVKITPNGEILDSWDDFSKNTSFTLGGKFLNKQGSSIFYFKPFDYRIFEYDGNGSKQIAEFNFTNNERYDKSDMEDIVEFNDMVRNTEYVRKFNSAAKVGDKLVVTYSMYLNEYGIKDFIIIDDLKAGKCWNYCLQEQGLCSTPFPGYGYYLCDKALITYTTASGFIMANGEKMDKETLSQISPEGNPVLMRFEFSN